jgi:hypothetical protein
MSDHLREKGPKAVTIADPLKALGSAGLALSGFFTAHERFW